MQGGGKNSIPSLYHFARKSFIIVHRTKICDKRRWCEAFSCGCRWLTFYCQSRDLIQNDDVILTLKGLFLNPFCNKKNLNFNGCNHTTT